MQVDVLFDPFGARWADVLEGARAAADVGAGGVWLYDHLAGSAHGADHVLECWTVLSAIAAAVPGIAIGPLVLNVANRDPVVLAVMAATLQEVSAGRLLLGIGAGGGTATPYAAEQQARGGSVAGDAARRRALESAVSTLRTVWTGRVDDTGGFLRPDPLPPVIVGGFGPKMAALAGRIGDGINIPAGRRLGELVEIARRAHDGSPRSGAPFVVTVSAPPSARALDALRPLDVDRSIIYIAPPFVDDVRRLGPLTRS